MAPRADGGPDAALIATIAAGGVLGSLGRWVVGLALPHADGRMPWGTLLVNVTGALAMGLLIAWLADRESPAWVRPFAATGLLGGWTTYSAFALDAVTLSPVVAVGYVAATVVLGVGACALGLRIGERLLGEQEVAT